MEEGDLTCHLSGAETRVRQWIRDGSLSREEANNLFFTTSALRDVHYAKQKNNAFYHMQAMDLPFQNIEFYFLSLKELEEEGCQDGSDQNL